MTATTSGSSAPAMEVSVLQANLSRIFNENSSMKELLVVKSHKIEELNKRIGEILAENQSFVEQSHKQLIARNSRFTDDFLSVYLSVSLSPLYYRSLTSRSSHPLLNSFSDSRSLCLSSLAFFAIASQIIHKNPPSLSLSVSLHLPPPPNPAFSNWRASGWN